MYRHDNNLKRAKTPEINQIYQINRAYQSVPERTGRTRTGRNRAKDFAKVYRVLKLARVSFRRVNNANPG